MPHDMQAGWPHRFGHDITRQFLETYSDEMYVHDAQGQFIDVNQTACDNLGYTREELLGMRVEQVSELERNVLEQIWAHHTPGTNALSANQHRRKDGSYYQLDVHITCLEISGQKYFMGLGRRAEQRHTIEAQVQQLNTQLKALLDERTRQWRASSRMLEAFMEQTPDGVFIKDVEGRYQYVNPALLKRAKRTLSEVIGHTDAEIFPSHIAQQYADADQEVLGADKPVLYEERLPVGDSALVFNVMKMPYRDEQGHIQGLLGMTRDITEMRLAQEQVDHNYAMLREAERVAKIGSWTLDLASNTFTASEMLTEMNGRTPEDPPLTPETLAAMIPPDEHAVLSASIAKCIQQGTPYTVDVQHKHPAGGTFPARIRGQAFRNAAGDITMLHGTLQDLSDHVEANQRLQALADNVPNGAIFRCEQTADNKLYLRYVSAGIQRLLGISAATFQAQQHTFTALLLEEDKPAFFEAVMDSLAKKTPFDLVSRVYNSQGQVHWMRARAAPRLTHQGTLWEGILLDVTAEYEVQESLRQAKEAAEAAERAKSEFLATMSHEIRTPMNTVIGMAQLLQQTPLSPKQRNYLDKATLSANALLKLINEILDFSKLEAEMLHIDPEPFHLDAWLESVHAVTGLPAEQKGLEIIYLIAPTVPRQLVGDVQRLGQVLTNLVGNAIKFTDRGEVLIRMDAQPDPHSPAHTHLTVAVRDTGIGIEPEHLSRLFEPFMQAEAHISRRFGGTGLGLAICQKLVHLMGGDIHVSSQLGQGSTFTFTVRLQSAIDTLPRKQLAQLQHKILVVDDNTVAREALRTMVLEFGLPCETAASGPEALQRLQAASQAMQPFELVLMDWKMPGMDGLETAQHIRSHTDLSHIPAILMVTAHCRDEVIDRVAQLQLKGLLIKPVTQSMLFDALHEALLASQPADSIQHPPSMLTASHLRIPASLQGRCVLVVDDNRMNREVAQDLLELAHIRVTTASSGREALALLQSTPFDAVLLDVQMPEMDGLAVARHIRSNPQWQHLPVWALTAQARTEDRHAILASGMNGQLTKPINAQLLFQTLEHAFLHRPAVCTDAAAPSTVARPPAMSGMTQHLGGQQDRIQRLLRAFVRDFAQAPGQFTALHHAQDWHALAMLAHTLKGAIGYLDHPAAVQAMNDLEWASQRQQVNVAILDRARTQLQQVLQHVQEQLHTPPGAAHAPPAPGMDTATLLAHLHQALPAIQRGDYAGIRHLELVENALRGNPLHGLAARALALTEDLETEAANQCLQQLRQALVSAPNS